MAESGGSVRSLLLVFVSLASLIFLGVWVFDEILAPKISVSDVLVQGLRVVIVLVFAAVAVVVVRRVRGRVSPRVGGQIASLYEFILILVIGIMALFSVLRVFGVDANTLLLSGGIISVTSGLIVSTFVGDTLAGMLVLLLNLYRVDDLVLVNGVPARVEQMSAFVSRFRNDAGGVISIPNTAIAQGSVVVTRFHKVHEGGITNRLPYAKGDRVYTTYMNAEGVVVELDPIHTRVRLDSGMEVTFLNNSVLSGSVAVARLSKSSSG